MTWGEVNEYITDKLAKGITNIDDYRPAGDMYIDDIVKIIPAGDRMWPTVPGGIRYWLADGDSIIYVPKAENMKDGNHE